MEQRGKYLMFWLSLAGGVYLIITGIIGKGRSFRSKMGTPLSEREVKVVRFTYISVGAILLVIAAISGIELLSI